MGDLVGPGSDVFGEKIPQCITFPPVIREKKSFLDIRVSYEMQSGVLGIPGSFHTITLGWEGVVGWGGWVGGEGMGGGMVKLRFQINAMVCPANS